MAEHEPSVGQSDDWYTPREIFDALGLVFDLDPCSPGPGHWVPARKIYTEQDDGLHHPWEGLVFMNRPSADVTATFLGSASFSSTPTASQSCAPIRRPLGFIGGRSKPR
jgi:hypothetical protein